MIAAAVTHYLLQAQQMGLQRQRCPIDSKLINFSSNDYLSLSEDKRIQAAFQKGFANYPSCSGGAMVICGYHAIHQELEQAFAQSLGVDDALLFSSGYAANLGVISMLTYFKSHFFIDKSVHASIYDGLKLSAASYERFLHNDINDLAKKLAYLPLNPLVVTEGVFSMSGQIAPLKQMAKICNSNKARLVVDEAHAFGLLGKEGLGAVQLHGLTQAQVPLRVIPLGKAFAFQCAVVCGRGEWIDALLNLARSSFYSTAPSPALAYGLLETLTIVKEAEERRQKLFQLVNYFQNTTKNSPLNWQFSQTPVQRLQLGCPHKALSCTQFLRSKGILCQAVREPTVCKKETGLRIILNYHHEKIHIDNLFNLLHSFL